MEGEVRGNIEIEREELQPHEQVRSAGLRPPVRDNVVGTDNAVARLSHEVRHCYSKSQIPLRYLVRSRLKAGRRQVRSWSATSFEPVCDQLRTS